MIYPACLVVHGLKRAKKDTSSDDNLLWLLARGYHVIAKGYNNRQANALANRVQRWDPYGDVWLNEVSLPIDYGQPVRVFVKRRRKDGNFWHSYYVVGRF